MTQPPITTIKATVGINFIGLVLPGPTPGGGHSCLGHRCVRQLHFVQPLLSEFHSNRALQKCDRDDQAVLIGAHDVAACSCERPMRYDDAIAKLQERMWADRKPA